MNIPGPRRRKHGQPHGDGLARILVPSVLAICVCTVRHHLGVVYRHRLLGDGGDSGCHLYGRCIC